MEVKLQWTGIRFLIELFVWVQLPRLPPNLKKVHKNEVLLDMKHIYKHTL